MDLENVKAAINSARNAVKEAVAKITAFESQPPASREVAQLQHVAAIVTDGLSVLVESFETFIGHLEAEIRDARAEYSKPSPVPEPAAGTSITQPAIAQEPAPEQPPARDAAGDAPAQTATDTAPPAQEPAAAGA